MPSAALLTTLSAYLTATRQLLRDSSGSLYTDADLTAFLNRAMRQRDLDLGLNRIRILQALTTGVYDYTFAAIAATGTVLDGNSNAILQDLLSITVIPLGGASSSVRYPLARWPYSKLAFMLSTSYPTYPVCYALYGPTTIMFAPPPAQNYQTEFDFTCYSPDLVNPTDADIMPYPFTDPVPFMAAAFAKMQAQRFDEAESFSGVYKERMNRVRARSRSIAVANPWSDIPFMR
jgi:hypothetical protein